MEAATCKEWLDTENWERVVKILQTDFLDGMLLTECTLQTVVLIPKGNE